MNLHDWLRHCEQLHPQTIDMGLERVTQVAQALKLSMPCPVITVAGTNGKGSTCAMLESVLRHAGYKTGLYTSPHLVHFEERCRLQGRPAQAAQLLLLRGAHLDKMRAIWQERQALNMQVCVPCVSRKFGCTVEGRGKGRERVFRVKDCFT